MEFAILKTLVAAINECPDADVVETLNRDLAKDNSDFEIVQKNGRFKIKTKKGKQK